VQDGEEADFCTEMLGIARNFERGFGTGAKQEIVEGAWAARYGVSTRTMVGFGNGETLPEYATEPRYLVPAAKPLKFS
jgi:hypothetical protein